MLNVVSGNNGKPRVSTVMPLPKGDEVAEQYHTSVIFSVDDYQKGNREAFNQLADGIRTIILRCSELQDSQDMGDVENNGNVDLTSDDDVPF